MMLWLFRLIRGNEHLGSLYSQGENARDGKGLRYLATKEPWSFPGYAVRHPSFEEKNTKIFPRVWWVGVMYFQPLTCGHIRFQSRVFCSFVRPSFHCHAFAVEPRRHRRLDESSACIRFLIRRLPPIRRSPSKQSVKRWSHNIIVYVA